MKVFQKIICAVVSLSVVIATLTCMATSSAAVANTPGDVNSDGSVNSFDALSIVRYCTGADTLTKAEIVAADVDLDGKVTSVDALYILQFTAGTIDRFPAQTGEGRIHIVGDYYYDIATGKVTNTDGSGLLGFSYDAKDQAFYASTYAWQRTFGYTYLYDVAAPFIACSFDTSRIFFEYNDMEWMVQLWKGQYGFVLNGCEIGLYYRDFDDDELVDAEGRKFYKCADDEKLCQMELTMYKNNTLFFHRSKQYSWWLTGFKPGVLDAFGYTADSTKVLKVSATIYFAEEEMMNAFIGGLENCTEIEHNSSKRKREINFRNGNFDTGCGYTVNRAQQSVTFVWE
ncbi:MAG TPA: hypothetical protein DCS04_09250 [Ruminococcaceae bacterium]|nr:hypothetical protein [Oscillospiraceae bacterium]